MPPREIGAVVSSQEMKTIAAQKSSSFICPECGVNHNDLISNLAENSFLMKKKKFLTSLDKLSPKRNKIKKKLVRVSKRSKLKVALKKILSFFYFFSF